MHFNKYITMIELKNVKVKVYGKYNLLNIR